MLLFILGFLIGLAIAFLLIFTVVRKKMSHMFAEATIKNAQMIYKSCGRVLSEKQLNELKKKFKKGVI
jgi:uncharacterized protein YneF (UPF0154 family)